jgi:Nucleotidyl transferase AbiEii toxin, Type IV TA system
MSRITPGWLARHRPQGPGGRQAALIDIAQDLLLAQLHQQGIFDHLVFKGGTALRKLYAGNAGRFSTDLDFSVRNLDDEPEAVTELLRREIDGQDIDGFRYSVEDHRRRAHTPPTGAERSHRREARDRSEKIETSARTHAWLRATGRGCAPSCPGDVPGLARRPAGDDLSHRPPARPGPAAGFSRGADTPPPRPAGCWES